MAHKAGIIDLLSSVIIPPILLVFSRYINIGSLLITIIYAVVGVAWGHTTATIVYWQFRKRRRR